MSEFGDAACAYAGRGWAVLPLKQGNKIPAIKGGCRKADDDVSQVRAWWSQRPDDNVGIATGSASQGLVVIDLDVDPDKGEDGYETLRDWEREHGELPETVTAITGRGGYHLYFQTNTPIANSVNGELGVDVRGDGGYVVAPPSLHPNGNRYEWEMSPDEYAVAEADDNVYAFLAHVQGERKSRGRFKLPDRIESGGRNDTLFKYASSLQAQGYDDVYMKMALEHVNAERCEPALPDADIETIISSVTGRYEKGENVKTQGDGNMRQFRKLDRYGRPTGAVLHNEVGAELIEQHRASIVDGAPAIWNGKRYASGWEEVKRVIVNLMDDCKHSDQKEICHYVHLKAPEVEASPATLIAFENGVLDIDFGMQETSDDLVITNVIPHDYDTQAYSKDADDFLDRVAAGDRIVRMNLEEVIGVCMYRANDFGQCPVLIGSGANGKSTFIHALRNVLGTENVSFLDLGMIGKNFQAGQLLGKLANLGDDISNERLTGDMLAVFKKICTGEYIYTDVKNGEGFSFRPYCTMVFSCNEFPSLGDSTEGMLRRLFPIPFDAHFSRTDADFDPRITDKLVTEEAAQYLIRLGIEGLQRVRYKRGFTPNERTEQLVDEVRNDNNNVLQWIDDQMLEADWFKGKVISDCYSVYQDWSARNGLFTFSQPKFTRRVNAKFGFKSVSTKRVYSSGRKNVRVFKLK